MTKAPETAAAPIDEDEIDLANVWGTVIDHKWLIFIVTTVFLIISVGYAFLAQPVFEADGLIQVEQKVPDLPGLSDLTDVLGASASEASTEIALITSRTNIGLADDTYNMSIQIFPNWFPLFGNFIVRHNQQPKPTDVAKPWFGMTRYGWGGEKLEISSCDVPVPLLDQNLELITGENGSYDLYASSIINSTSVFLFKGKVGELDKGNGVTMRVKTLQAHPGMRFQVVCYFDIDEIDLLQTQITAAETETDSGIITLAYDNPDPVLALNFVQKLMEFYVKQNVDMNAQEAATSLKFVREQLPIVHAQLDRATDALNRYQLSAGSVDITMQTKGLLDQEVAVESSIQQLREQQADIERRYTPQHPAYQALMQQIGLLQTQKTAFEKQVDKLPDTQQDLLRLTRDVTVDSATYTGLLSQAQQLDIARAGTVGNVRIVDNATVDITTPVSPKKPLVIIGGAFLGGFLAVAFVFIRQLLRRGVEDPADIERAGLTVYASIPSSEVQKASALTPSGSGGNERQHLLMLEAPDDPATEAMRSLRTSLHFARLEAKNNVLMIAGSSPNAGKTFVAANLAVAVAQSGQRVLLIDGDLRLGTLHKVVGGRAEVGLSELISGQTDLAKATRVVENQDDLHFISRGNAPPNPSELLMNARFTALLDQLKPLYDLIIIDTPPILAVTDAAVIGSHAGTSLLVVRFGLNQVREVMLAKQRFEQNGVEIKGAIFNAVEKRHAGYASYGYYQYKTSNK